MGEVALRKVQGALEATRGTPVAATRKVYATGHLMKDINLLVPVEDRGTFIQNYRSIQGVVTASATLDGGASYEDLPWWCQMMLKGGVTGTVSGVTAYTYLFVPTAGVDDIKTADFEWGDETQAYRMIYAMVDSWEIKGEPNGFWSFTANLIGNDMATFTFTAALGERTVEDVNMYLTKLAIGAAGAVPSSYMTGRFISFSLTGKNNLARKYFSDGVAPTLGGIGRGKREFALTLRMEGNAATIAERTVWEAGTSRVARITATGSAIAGSTGPIYRSVDIVFPGKWETVVVAERDTNTVLDFTMRNEYDSVLGYDLSVSATNALATLP